MTFHPFSVTTPHIAYAVLGGFVVLFGMFSLLIREKLYIGEAPLAFVFGVVIGPYGAGIIDPRAWGGGADETTNTVTLEITRVILAVGVFAIGVELPKAYVARHWKSLFFLLVPVMSWGWLVSAGLIYALIPGLSFLSSLAVAACLTPTDPILAAAVVGGKYADKHVPAHLRHLLAAESGCNDGAAFPFLYIALYFILDKTDKKSVRDWFLITWLYEVILGIAIGAFLGLGFRHLMKFCERRDLIDKQSYVAQYVALAMLTIGVCTLLGTDDLLAAFSCGTAFAWDGFFNRQTEQSVFSSVIDLLFNIVAFVFIGAWTPFSSFTNPELTLSVWRLIVIALLILLLRRLPIMLALYRWIPDVKTFREAIFSGHFGPIGVGAIFISTLATEALPVPVNPLDNQEEFLAATIQPIVSFMVLCSIALHGLSIPFFSLGRRVHSVSRTWSRHQSMDPNGLGPEWATQTRRVTRPEDIVINRDDVLERGELKIEENLAPTDALTEEDTEKGSGAPSVQDNTAQAHGLEGDISAATQGRPDYDPDREPSSIEWQEGSDIVVEHRLGHGEDVEVEVIHGVALNGAGELGSSHPTSIPSEHVHNGKGGLANLGNTTQAVQETFEHKESSDEGTESPSDASKQGEIRAVAVEDANVGGNEDDEGWASEHSNSEVTKDDHESSIQGSHRRSRSLKHKGKHGSGSSHGDTARRFRALPLRRNVLSRPSTAPSPRIQPPPFDGGEVDSLDEQRGRQPPSRSSSKFLHHRVDSLRTPVMSRSASPARSLRSILNNPDNPASRDEQVRDSPRQLVFDLPRDMK